MKNFLLFTMKNIHYFDVFFCRNKSVSIQIRNLRIFASQISKVSKVIAPNLFLKILISMPPENFSPHYQFGFQLNRG